MTLITAGFVVGPFFTITYTHSILAIPDSQLELRIALKSSPVLTMEDSLNRDVESGSSYVEYKDGEKEAKTAAYFWNKPKPYVMLYAILTLILLTIVDKG